MFIFLPLAHYTKYKENISKDKRDFAYKVKFSVTDVYRSPNKRLIKFTRADNIQSLSFPIHRYTPRPAWVN